MKTYAILLAAGKGERLGSDKALCWHGNMRLIEHSLEVFEQCKKIDKVIVVAGEQNIERIKKIANKYSKVANIVLGGRTRFESTICGFKSCKAQSDDFLLFHNVANPFLTEGEVEDCIASAKRNGAAGVAHQSTSTIRILNDKNHLQLIPREKVFLMETPQVLRVDIFKNGLKEAKKQKINPTDDLVQAELSSIEPKIIAADFMNRKITYIEDLNYSKGICRHAFNNLNFGFCGQSVAVAGNCCSGVTKCRAGIGHDSHKFSSSGICILGGLKFHAINKLEAQSDGDVALHALTNAILSTFGEGSLSCFSDQLCREGVRDSVEYLNVALSKLQDRGGRILNCSLSFECLKPKLEERFPQMQRKIAKMLNLNPRHVGLTVTSGEDLTAFGKGKGVQVFALVLAGFNK